MIVPDEILENNICRKCNQYLTVSPICIHPEGGNICGRCETNQKPSILFQCDYNNLLEQELNIPYALFAYTNHLFPCVNRYEGCKELLLFNNIARHEAECKWKKVVLCKECRNFEGVGSQQLIHFKRTHPDHFHCESSHFRLAISRRNQSNLVKKNNDLFFVDVEVDGKQIRFHVKPFMDFTDKKYEFFALLRSTSGEEVAQSTTSRKGVNHLYHQIDVNCAYSISEDMFCECLLKVY